MLGLSDSVAGRFELRGRLGEGGMGVVFRAFDVTRQREVALKTMQGATSDSIVRFKNEFRTLCGISHPNLVTMYELVAERERLFVAMELVSGPTLLSFVRGEDLDGADSNTRTTMDSGGGVVTAPAVATARPVRFDRLVEVAWQAATGLAYLHAQGILHRDIKPSNILIREESHRVMLCDFGLSQAISAAQHGRMEGTLAFLSPEVCSGMPASEASDWYAFGTTLYECLLGRVPFLGTGHEIIRDRTSREALPPRAVDPSIDAAWDRLVVGLLKRDPETRLSGDDVLSGLNEIRESLRADTGRTPRYREASESGSVLRPRRGGASSSADSYSQTGVSTTQHELHCYGREAERAAVTSHIKAESARAAYLVGRSGFGKSTLAEAVARDIAGDNGFILRGRCNEAEHLPFKALDGIIDQLSGDLVDRPVPEIASGLERASVSSLLQLFPALGRVEALSDATEKELLLPHGQRRRLAFGALKELLHRVHRARPLVLVIDDLQWVDNDSVELLRSIFDVDDAPAVAIVGTYRDDELANAPLLRGLLSTRGVLGARSYEQPVGPLTSDGALTLARHLSGEALPSASVERAARLSHGNPFLVHELISYALADDGDALVSRTFDVDEMLSARIRLLPDDARELLRVVCVSGRATSETTLRGTYSGSDIVGALSSLRAGSLVRWRLAAGADAYEPFHDRIREVTVSQLARDEQRGIHRQLVEVIQAQPITDYDALVTHSLAGGLHERVGEFAARAAAQAKASMAFTRAADLYELAVAHAPDDADLSALRVEHAQNRALAGQSREAADLYLALAESYPERSQHFKSQAVGLLMGLGETELGSVILTDVALRARVPIPRSEGVAIALWLWRIFRLKLARRRFTPLPATDEQLNRLDVLWFAATALAMSNTAASQALSTLSALWAYRGADPQRLARSIVGEVLRHAIGTKKARSKARGLLETAFAIEGVDRDKLAVGHYAEVLIAYQAGRFDEAIALSETALEKIRTYAPDETWALVSTQLAQTWSLFRAGDGHALRRRVYEYREESERTGSMYGMAMFRSGISGAAELFCDEPEALLENGREALRMWPKAGHQLEHHFQMLSEVYALLMLDRADEARAFMKTKWRAHARSGLGVVVPLVDLEALCAKARAALAASGDPTSLKDVRRVARRIRQFPEAWYQCFATQFDALADLREGRSDAAENLGRAVDELKAHGMNAFAEATRLRQAEALGGEQGEAVYTRASDALLHLGAVNPARCAKALAPCGRIGE